MLDMEYIEEQAEGLVYVNVYAVSRHYGGPEEGGWWYNAGEPLESLAVDVTAARATVQAAHERWDSYARGDIYSVLGGVEVRVCVENHFAKHWPEERPRYS